MRENSTLQGKMPIPKKGIEENRLTKKILVIDDEPLLIDLMVHLLSLLGYQVESALDHHAAAGKLKDQKYDLIFLDMKMPMMDGKTFYLKMNEYFPEQAKRIVFLTGDFGNQETLNFILETKNAYLSKPFTLKEIKNLLDRIFQDSQAE